MRKVDDNIEVCRRYTKILLAKLSQRKGLKDLLVPRVERVTNKGEDEYGGGLDE